MGTFTVATGFGMLGVGILALAIIGAIGLCVIKSQAQQKNETNSKSEISKQIEGLRR